MNKNLPLNVYQQEILTAAKLNSGHSGFDANFVIPWPRDKDFPAERIAQTLKKRHPMLSALLELDNEKAVLVFNNKELLIRNFHSRHPLTSEDAYGHLRSYPLDPFNYLLFRLGRIVSSSQEFVYFTVHHLIADGVTQEQLLHDFKKLCAGEDLPDISSDSFFGAQLQLQEKLDRANARLTTEKLLRDWQNIRPGIWPAKGSGNNFYYFSLKLTQKESDFLRSQMGEWNVTPNTYFASVLAEAVFQFCGGEDIAVAMTASRRAGLEDPRAFGHYVNLFPCRLQRRADHQSVQNWFQSNGRRILKSTLWSVLPFGKTHQMLAHVWQHQACPLSFNYTRFEEKTVPQVSEVADMGLIEARNFLGFNVDDNTHESFSVNLKGNEEVLAESAAQKLFELFVAQITERLGESMDGGRIQTLRRVSHRGPLQLEPEFLESRENISAELLLAKLNEILPCRDMKQAFPGLSSLQKVLFAAKLIKAGIKVAIPKVMGWDGDPTTLQQQKKQKGDSAMQVLLFPDVTGHASSLGARFFSVFQNQNCEVVSYVYGQSIEDQASHLFGRLNNVGSNSRMLIFVAYSFGALLAFETAKKLEAIGRSVRVLLLDSRLLCEALKDEQISAFARLAYEEILKSHRGLCAAPELYDHNLLKQNLHQFLEYQPAGSVAELIHFRSRISQPGKSGDLWLKHAGQTQEFIYEEDHEHIVESAALLRDLNLTLKSFGFEL